MRGYRKMGLIGLALVGLSIVFGYAFISPTFGYSLLGAFVLIVVMWAVFGRLD